MPTRSVVIVGAGLAGSLLACFLARRGWTVDVFEGRSDPRSEGYAGGRSINLAISARGLHALRRVDLEETVLAEAIPMRGRMMHDTEGRLTFQPYSKDPKEAINSVSRGGLSLALIRAADAHDNVTFHFDHRCLDVDLETSAAVFGDAAGAERRAQADLVVGADGAYSAVRARLQRTDRFDYAQAYLEHGYKELTIPPSSNGEFAMEPHALHIWPRGGFMMIALPNMDRSFTCTCFWPLRGPGGLETLRTAEVITGYFETWFRDAVPLVTDLVEAYQANPNGSLVTIRCRPYHHDDTVVLIGDAAHAIVPFFGQGANAAFEDCVLLDEILATHGDDLGAALAEFSRTRKPHADAIADMAIENFIEMRDKVNSRMFLLRKKIEKRLHGWFPRRFIPRYEMVTFSLIPYASARARAARQDRMLAVVGVAVLVLLVALVAGAGVWLL